MEKINGMRGYISPKNSIFLFLDLFFLYFPNLPAWKFPPHSPGLGSCPGGGSDMSSTWGIFQFFSPDLACIQFPVGWLRGKFLKRGKINSPVGLSSRQQEPSLSRTHRSSSLENQMCFGEHYNVDACMENIRRKAQGHANIVNIILFQK